MSDFDENNEHLDDMDREILMEDELEEKRRRGIHFLPNALTTGAMFFGFYAIMMAINGDFEHAVWSVVLAGVFDMMDGRVARMVKSSSPFGQEYDSLSDLISFGFAPAMIAYMWALKDFDRLGWGVTFLYVACAAIRLAKFNVLTGDEESKKFFRGIPSPGAAGLIIIMVMLHMEIYPGLYGEGAVPGGLPPDAFVVRGGMLIWVIVLALLMVSNVRFRTFKDVNFKKYGPWLPLAGLVGIIAVFLSAPVRTLIVVGLSYLTLGILEGGIVFRRREKELREKKRELRRQRRIQRKMEKARARQAKKEAKKKDIHPVD